MKNKTNQLVEVFSHITHCENSITLKKNILFVNWNTVFILSLHINDY